MKSISSISVAIATYNRAAMVRQAIEAAFAQTLAPVEVCVTDDASTDATWETLQSWAAADPRLRIVRQTQNTGGVENWNRAIAETSGAYIAWCSDDDRFLPGHLAASAAYLDQHPEVGLVHAGFLDAIETTAGSETLSRPLRFPHDQVLTREDLLSYLTHYYDWPFHPSTIVMRRAVWEQVGPFDARFALADTDWFIRALELFPAVMLARHGVLNRRHPGNWSNRVGSARMQGEICSMVGGAIDRRYPRQPLRRWAWTWIWRWNVRLRLLLTVSARMRSGHATAACTAWRQVFQGTGLAAPEALIRTGERAIGWWSRRRAPAFEDARQSVSPL